MDRTSTNLWNMTEGVLNLLDHHLHVTVSPFVLKKHCGHCECKGKVVPQYAMKAYGRIRA
jgi:hypothetical protein